MKGESRLIVGDKEPSSGPVGINHLEVLLTATTTPPPPTLDEMVAYCSRVIPCKLLRFPLVHCNNALPDEISC